MKKFRELKIGVVAEESLHFGQKIYKIEPKGCETFSSKCPICDGKRTVTLKGMDLPCPYCQSTALKCNSLVVSDWVVVEYIVNKIIIEGPQIKSVYDHNISLDAENCPEATFCAFRKSPDVYSSIVKGNFVVSNIEDRSFFERALFYINKKDAATICKRKHREQKEKLREFNEEHGTNYEYPFIW